MYVDISFCKRVSDRGLKALINNCSELRYSLIRKRHPLGPYRRPMRRALWSF